MDEVSRGPRSWLWANNENFTNRRTKNNNQGQAGDPIRPLVGEGIVTDTPTTLTPTIRRWV